MNYILNTKAKKIEIYWDNQNEYQGLINFLSQYPITEENSPHIVKRETYSPNTITWANNSYSTSTADAVRAIEGITCTDSLSGTITLSNDAVSALKADDVEIKTALKTAIQPREDKPEYWLNANPVELHTGRHSQ